MSRQTKPKSIAGQPEVKKPPTLRDILLKHLPAAGEKILTAMEEDIKEFYGEKMGYRLQWRTKLCEAVHPEDVNLPKEKQRILFRFEARAGDFLDPSIEIKDFSINYRQKEDV